MGKKLYVLCGLPGCGKSTWAQEKKEYMENQGYRTEIVSTDAIRGELYGDENIQGNGKLVFDKAYQKIEANLKPQSTVDITIFDATNLHERDRAKLLRRFAYYGVKVVLVYFNVPIDKCLYRNERRARRVPEEVIRRMYCNMDVPKLDEGFDDFMIVCA